MWEKLKFEDGSKDFDTPSQYNFYSVEPDIVDKNNEAENKIILNESNNLPQNTIEMV